MIKAHSVKDFSEFWARVSLPEWERHGAKHIGSWSYLSDGPEDELLWIFEFKNIKHFREWQKWLYESDEGKALKDKLNPFIKPYPGRKSPQTNPALLKKVPY